MFAKLDNGIEINKKVWLWTSLALFFLLSLVNPTGTANSDSLLQIIINVATPPNWGEGEPGSLAEDMIFVLLYVAAVAFLSGLSGWLLHFLVAPFFQKPMSTGTSMRSIPDRPAGQCTRKRTIVFSAIGGASAAVFAAGLTQLHGLQFWAVWFCYDCFNKAMNGYHSWSTYHGFLLLVFVCGLNAMVSAIIAKHIRSDNRRIRVRAIVALGIQFASLVITAENLGFDASY